MAAEGDVQELTADFGDGQNAEAIDPPFFMSTAEERTKSVNQSVNHLQNVHRSEGRMS